VIVTAVIFAPIFLSEKDAVLDCLDSELRPVGRDQDILEHNQFLWLVFTYSYWEDKLGLRSGTNAK
jgi:hypothetical protein